MKEIKFHYLSLKKEKSMYFFVPVTADWFMSKIAKNLKQICALLWGEKCELWKRIIPETCLKCSIYAVMIELIIMIAHCIAGDK